MPREGEAERYRKAADLALRQLDWCETYLRTIHKKRLAQRIAENNASIRRRLDEPVGGDGAGPDLHEPG